MTKKGKTDIVIAVVKNKKGKVLILKRFREETSHDGKKLSWVFPGGKINGGETKKEAVIRETKMETGFNIKVKKEISNRDHPQYPVHITYYDCALENFEVTPIEDIHEVERIKWVEPKNLKEYFDTNIDPGVSKFLKL